VLVDKLPNVYMMTLEKRRQCALHGHIVGRLRLRNNRPRRHSQPFANLLVAVSIEGYGNT